MKRFLIDVNGNDFDEVVPQCAVLSLDASTARQILEAMDKAASLERYFPGAFVGFHQYSCAFLKGLPPDPPIRESITPLTDDFSSPHNTFETEFDEVVAWADEVCWQAFQRHGTFQFTTCRVPRGIFQGVVDDEA